MKKKNYIFIICIIYMLIQFILFYCILEALIIEGFLFHNERALPFITGKVDTLLYYNPSCVVFASTS